MPSLHAPATLPVSSNRGVGGAVFLGLFAVLAVMACFKYLALHSTVCDLGVFLSNLYSVHTYGQWWRAFLGHAQPLLPLYALIYRLVPDQAAPLVLLILQAFALALPALLAARRYGLLAALAYALYFPVWTNGLFDFHLDHLLIPILFGFLAAARSQRFGLAVALGLLPCLIKEPYALTTVCCGAYLAFVSGERKSGWWLMILGALYFYVVTVWLVPYCTVDDGSGAPGGAFAWLGGGPGAALLTCLTHPATVLGQMFGTADKWNSLFFLFGALLFFPLFRPKLLLPALPALLLPLLSSQPGDSGWTSHYTAGAAGALFFAFCEVLGPVRILARQSGSGVRQFGLVLFAALGLGHFLLAPSPVSRLFLLTDNFAFSMEAYEPTARDAAILAEILKAVPRDPDVPVVSQNTLNWGALAERLDYDSFPLGVFTPHPVRDLSGATLADFWKFVRTGQTDLPVRTWQAQYVLLDLTRPWFVRDQGCAFHNGACQDKDVADAFTHDVDKAKAQLQTVYDEGGFLILRRPGAKPAPAPAARPEVEPAAPQRPAPGQNAPASPTNGAAPAVAPAQQPGAPAGQTAAPAGQPAAPAVAPATPAPGNTDQIEVEELDRFPSQRTQKKARQAHPDAQAAPDAAPATNGGATVAPDAAPPPADVPVEKHRRSRRHKDATDASAQTAPAGGENTPTTDGAAAVGPGSADAPAQTPTTRQSRSRRHKKAADVPAQAAPAGGENVPAP